MYPVKCMLYRIKLKNHETFEKVTITVLSAHKYTMQHVRHIQKLETIIRSHFLANNLNVL